MSPVVIKYDAQSTPSYSSGPSEPYSGDEDGFSVGQAFQDWYHLLIAPRVFCEEQEGAAGMLSPLALTLAYSLLFGVFYLIMLFGWGGRMGMEGILALFMVVLVVPLCWLIYIVFCLVCGGLLHVTSLVFGGKGAYSSSFRATVYSLAPSVALLTLAGGLTLVFVPGWLDHTPHETSIFQVLANLIGFAWGAVLLGMSIRATQRLTIGSAIGVTIVSIGLLAGLFVLLSETILMLKGSA